MDEREKNIPRWAQELIGNLRTQLRANAEPLVREIAKLRPINEQLKAENEAYRELLDCAARGKHMTAEAIINLLEGYSLILVKDE